jgi:hypothetical protein
MNAKIILLVGLALGLHMHGPPAVAAAVYFNDFNGPLGSQYREWTSSAVNYSSAGNPPGKGTLAPQVVTNVESPNHAQRFLGEFGGPQIGTPGDPGYIHTRVEQTVSLTLRDLPPHATLKVSFDLYILKSWDGLSPAYGPDRWTLGIAGGPVLLATTFSNNPKAKADGSYQNYPHAKSLPRSGAVSTNTLGFGTFFGDSIYHFDFTFAHSDSTLILNFTSSLFEGKGADDESWGLDNVRITVVQPEVAPYK